MNYENNLERLGSRTNLRERETEVELTWTWVDLQTLAEVLWRENGWVRALIFQNDLQLRDLGCFRGLDTLWTSPLGPTVWQPLTLGHSIKECFTFTNCEKSWTNVFLASGLPNTVHSNNLQHNTKERKNTSCQMVHIGIGLNL